MSTKATKTQHQIILENLFNNNQLMTRIHKEYHEYKDFDFTKDFKEHDIDPEFGFALLVQMALHKRADITTLVGCLRNKVDSAQECADEIVKCANAGYIDWDERTHKFIVVIDISDSVQQELDRFQFPLPMAVKPAFIAKNDQSGYLTKDHDSVILQDNHHEDDVCLDHLNRLNSIGFRINETVAKFVKNKWRNLAHKKEGETKADFDKRRKAFEKYDRVSKSIMDLLCKEGNEFYFTHKYDKRGRVYCQGYHLSYQGTDYNKATLLFAKEEMVED